MLVDLFSIKVMSKIFKEESKCSLSLKSRLLYQNLLEHHFTNKEETIANLEEFGMNVSDIPKYEKFLVQFNQLASAGLISFLSTKQLVFNQVWVKHINLSRMTERHKMSKAGEFTDEMYNSHQLIELVAMKNKIKRQEVNQLLQLFFSEQDAIGKDYLSENECRKHFIYWAPMNLNKVVKEKVTSNSKILGQK